MAGAKYRGLLRSQARTTQVKRLSQIPTAIFAIVFASRGAMIKTSAHFLNSMCKTSSEIFFQVDHSSSSRNISTGDETLDAGWSFKSFGLKK